MHFCRGWEFKMYSFKNLFLFSKNHVLNTYCVLKRSMSWVKFFDLYQVLSNVDIINFLEYESFSIAYPGFCTYWNIIFWVINQTKENDMKIWTNRINISNLLMYIIFLIIFQFLNCFIPYIILSCSSII